MTPPRRALILAGGGMRVAYQAGVIKALHEKKLTFAHVDGTSGGTINLAMLLSGLDADEMCDRWRTLRVRDFASLLPAREYRKVFNLKAMGDADGIRNKVFPHLGIDVERIRASTGVTGTFNICNFTRKTNEVVSHQQVDLDALVAGISLPIFMPTVRRNGDEYTDSVWIKDANLWEAVKQGAEELWLVWCIGNSPTYRDGTFHQYVHMIELSANGALFEEFDRIRDLNERIERGDSPFGQRSPIRLHVVKPSRSLPLDPDLFFGNITTSTLIALGYADARRYLDQYSDEGLPFQPEVTQMNDSKAGISFRETMSGPFALNDDQVKQSKRAVGRKSDRLSLHASILIPDIAAFVADPMHEGHISGTVDFEPLGMSMDAPTGVFRLFVPTNMPDLKHMVYEVRFEHGGQNYYLAGKKEVRDDSPFDVWSDTTTLLTQLHRGDDDSAPVIGAGVLRLGVGELFKLITTMRAVNASSVRESARAMSTFGGFFASQLWDTYVRKRKASA